MVRNQLLDEMRAKYVTPEVQMQVDMAVRIANRVYDILEERGLSQRDFATMLGKSETEVCRWLSGTHNLTLATIAKMSVALGEDLLLPRPPKRRKQQVQTIMPKTYTYHRPKMAYA